MASDTNNIGLYMAAPASGQSTGEVMTGIGTPVMPDGSVQSQVGSTQSYWEANEVQTGQSRDCGEGDTVAAGISKGDGDSFGGSPPTDNNQARPVGLDTRYGEGIGFSVATDGDYMAVGAPYAWKDFSFPAGSENLKGVAEQIWSEGFGGDADCFGAITLTINSDLKDLFPGWTSWTGEKFCFMDRVWTITQDLTGGESPPTSWSAGDALLVSYTEGADGLQGSAELTLYPCDKADDCWEGDVSCAATKDGLQNSIGFIVDEAGEKVLYQDPITISSRQPAVTSRVQSGVVYVFKKPRGLITNATNATPIVVTADSEGFDVLWKKGRGGDLSGYDQINQAKIKIEGVGGNKTANGEYFLKYISSTTASLYHDKDLRWPVAGGGAFTSGGTFIGIGPDTWIKAGAIEAPFPGGYSERNVEDLAASSIGGPPDPCTGLGGDVSGARLVYSDSRFGWSIDFQDGWILVGEPRGKRPKDGLEWGLNGVEKNNNEPREGSFAEVSILPKGEIQGGGFVEPNKQKLNQLSGDTSPSGRVYIYHVDRIDENALFLGHPNPHLNYAGRGSLFIPGSSLKGKGAGYTGLTPNARIVPEYLYLTSADPEVTYNMGYTDSEDSHATSYLLGRTPLTIDTHFGHSVAFSPAIEGAPFGPDNPVTILVGAPYSRIDKNEAGILGAIADEDGAGPGDSVPAPDEAGGFGGDEQFEGGGSSGGGTVGEGGEQPGEPPSESDDSSPPRERINKVGHAYAFIGAYPDSGNASYAVWKGLPNLYMGNENIGTVEYNASDVKSSGAYAINNLIGREKVDDGKGNLIDVEPIEDIFKWQRLEHRIYGHNDEESGDLVMFDGRSAQDRFGWSVGIHKNTVIVGAPRHNWNTDGSGYLSSAGAAYVFTRSSSSGYFDTVNPVSSGVLFTKYVGIDENIVAISGASSQHHRGQYDNFGYSVVVDKNFFAVGAPRHAADRMGRDFSKGEAGAVFVWAKQPGGTYEFDQKLCHNNETYGSYYGPHVGNTTDPTYVIGSGRDAYSHFGASLSLCGSNLLVGAPLAGGGLTYDKKASHYTRKDIREKLSTEYEKGGDEDGLPSLWGYGGNYNQNDYPDNMNIRILYRGWWLKKLSYKIYPGAGTDYTGSGRTYLFQRQTNREDTKIDVTTTVGSDVDDATINSGTESYEDSSDTITAGGSSTSAVYGLLRFSSLGIPRGSQIHNAYIDLVSSAEDDSQSTITIYAFDEDDGEMPSGGDDDSPDASGQEYANFITKFNTKKTLNKIVWTIASTKVGKKVTTFPLSVMIQEIVDRPGWSDNNSIVIIFGPGEGSAYKYNTKKSFYSSNYGHRYTPFGQDLPEIDTRPRIYINYSEVRDNWKQTHEFSPPTTQISSGDIDMGWKDYGRSVHLSKENITIGCPEYELDMLVGGDPDSPSENGLLSGGSGAMVHRDFVGLGCLGYGLPGTPGGNFPHIFSLNTKGAYFLASGMDLHSKGYAVDSGNITLALPKAHLKFSHAMPLYVGPVRARTYTSLYTRGLGIIGGGPPGPGDPDHPGTGPGGGSGTLPGDHPDLASGPHTMSLVMTFRATGNMNLFLKNYQATGGMPLMMQPPLPASGTAELFTIGPIASSGNITLHQKGHLCFNSPVGNYPEGYPSLFVSGVPTQVTATGSLYTSGPIVSSGFINITGPYDLPASGKISLYTRGLSSDSTTLNVFLEKSTGDIDDGIKLYTSGPLTQNSGINLFAKYDPKCASSATSSHSIVKFKKQQTIIGDSYRTGGVWGSRVMDFLGDSDSDEYSEETKAQEDHYFKKQNDSIDIHGQSMAVGTPGAKYAYQPIGYNYLPHINGNVKIYNWDGDTNTWTLGQTILHPNDATEVAPQHSEFGLSVAIDDTNSILIIGEPSSDINDTGKAHVYRKTSGTWTYEATIDGSTVLTDGSIPSVNDKKLGDRFGHYVAIDGGVIIVGAPGQDYGTDTTIKDSRINSGAVYVLEYDSSSSRWERTQKLVNPDRNIDFDCLNTHKHEQSYFGLICKIKGNTIVIGAPSQSLRVKNGDTSIGHVEGGGATYIFDKSGTWSFTKAFYSRGQSSTNNGTVDSSITYVSADYNANFGASLDFYDNNIVIGAPKKQVSSKDRAGESYILEKSGGTWSLKYTIIPTETFSDGSIVHSSDDLFGYHVSILNEDVVLIGSPKHDYGVAPSTTANTAGINTGAIYIFGIKGGNQIRKLVREEVVSSQFFGYNNVAFESIDDNKCNAQLVSLIYGKNTSESANIIELYQYLSAFPLNVRGPMESDSNITLHSEGMAVATGTIPLFSEGMSTLNTTAGDPGDFPLMLLGPSGINATGTLYTKGLSPYQTVMNLNIKASMIGPKESSDNYSTLSLKMRGPLGASSAGWQYHDQVDHRYASKFNITVQSGFYTDNTNAFHINDNYPPYYYNANPPVYKWGDPILERGRSYVFDLSDESNAGHTFYLSSVNDGGGGHAAGNYEGEFLIGVTGSRATQGEQLHFNVPDDAPDYLYVHCGHHANMGWRIQIINQRASTPQGMPLYINPLPTTTNKKMQLLIEGAEDPRGIRSNASMNLIARVREVTPVSSGMNLYTRSIGETAIENSSYMSLWVQSTGIQGGANVADYMNMFLKPQTKVDVTTNMNLSLLTPAYPTGSMTLYLHNIQTKKEANIFTEATGGMNLFLNTTSGTPFGVLPSSSMNLVIPMKGLSGGQQLASRSFDGTFPDVGLDLYIGNTEATGSVPLFTRAVQSSTGIMPLSMTSTLGVHSGLSTFMIRGYDDSASGV